MAAAAEEPPQEELVPVPPPSDEDFELLQAHFSDIFAECEAETAKAASLAERKEQNLEQPGLTYSETDIEVVHQLLKIIKADHGPLFQGKGVFLDIGSGTGKACVAAGLLHPFEKVVGIETLQCLNDMANKALAKYQEAQLPEGVAKLPIEFIKGDFVAEFEAKLDPLAPQVTVCMASATHYSEAQMQAVTTMAKKMPDNSIFILFTMRLPEAIVIDLDRHPSQRRAQAVKKACSVRGVDPDTVEVTVLPPENDPNGWAPLFSEEVQLTWGPATCFVYKKVPTESSEEEPPAEAPPEPPAEP